MGDPCIKMLGFLVKGSRYFFFEKIVLHKSREEKEKELDLTTQPEYRTSFDMLADDVAVPP